MLDRSLRCAERSVGGKTDLDWINRHRHEFILGGQRYRVSDPQWAEELQEDSPTTRSISLSRFPRIAAFFSARKFFR